MARLSEIVADSTRASGLGTRQARWAMVAVWALNVAYEIVCGYPVDHPWVWASYAAGLAGALVLTSSGSGRLDPGRAGLLVALALFAGTALFAHPGLNTDVWIFSYATYLPALAIARGNPIAGGIGSALLILMGAWYAGMGGAGPAEYVALLNVPISASCVGFLWRWWFRRTVQREQRLRGEAERSRLDAEAAEASIAEMRQAFLAVHEEAAPLLQALSEGERMTPTLRHRLTIAEAQIRDRLVAPGISDPLLADRIRARRELGVHVLLLGHIGEDGSSEPLAEALIARLADDISTLTDATRIVVRQHPPGSAAACTLMAEWANGRVLHRYSAQGDRLR
ncbi:MAG: hypothetical protein J0H64_01155 [Actinobacteria bacterium]|nr:hypothetical protein [Actinomycetota bacterium]